MINDISQCLQQAQALARQIHNIRQKDRNFIKAFTSWPVMIPLGCWPMGFGEAVPGEIPA